MIEKITDGNKTTVWRALVDDSESESRVIQKVNRGVSENETQVGVKETIKKQKEIKRSADKPPTPPEVKLFREVTERYPNKINFQDVTNIIQGVSKRLGRECSADDLRPFYAAWCANGWNKLNLAWLAYAERGELPTIQKGKSTYGQNKQITTQPEYTDADRKLAEQIRAERQAVCVS